MTYVITLRKTLFLSALFSNTLYALPFFILPNGALPTSVVQGQTTTASYKVINITTFTPPFSYVKWLPPNVTVANTSTCSPSTGFQLAPGQSCILDLLISGSVNRNDPDPHHHLFVCMSDRVSCAGPTPENSLNVTLIIPTPIPAGIRFTTVGTSFDIATNALGYFTTNGGITWTPATTQPPHFGPGANELFGVSCASDGLHCAAVGTFDNGVTQPLSYTTTDGGNTWSISNTLPPPQGADPNILRAIDCSNSGLLCTSVGNTTGASAGPLFYFSTDGGVNWSVGTPPPLTFITTRVLTVACAADGLHCVSLGDVSILTPGTPVAYFSNNGGATWTSATTPPPEINPGNTNLVTAVSCSDDGLRCVAVGQFGTGLTNQASSYFTTDGGVNWTASPSQPPVQGTSEQMRGVSCDSSGIRCVAVGQATIAGNPSATIYLTTDGALSWTSITVTQPSTNAILTGVKCKLLNCTAVGSYDNGTVNPAPFAYYSSDGGSTWALSFPPIIGANGDGLNAVS